MSFLKGAHTLGENPSGRMGNLPLCQHRWLSLMSSPERVSRGSNVGEGIWYVWAYLCEIVLQNGWQNKENKTLDSKRYFSWYYLILLLLIILIVTSHWVFRVDTSLKWHSFKQFCKEASIVSIWQVREDSVELAWIWRWKLSLVLIEFLFTHCSMTL